MKNLFLLFLAFLFVASCSDTTSLIQELKDKEKMEAIYQLYPSTLRMLNFEDIPSYDKLVKNVEKITVHSMIADSFDLVQMLAFSESLQMEEGYDVYMEVDDEKRMYAILGKQSSDKTMFLLSEEESGYIVDVIGQPDFLELPKIINSLKEDSTGTNGFSMFMDLIAKDSKWEKKNRERRKRWKEKNEAEAAALQQRQDSILHDSAKEIKN